MKDERLHSCAELIDYINEVGFLPLLRMGVEESILDTLRTEGSLITRRRPAGRG